MSRHVEVLFAIVLLSAGLVVALTSCTSTRAMPVEPDIVEVDSGSAPYQRACANLARLGCPEASPGDAGLSCAQTLARAASLAEVPTACLSTASTVDAARACGSTNTLRVRCVH